MKKIVIGFGVLVLSLYSMAADPAPSLKLFADEPWYKQAEAKEQVFEGVLRKEASPTATSGRWNPVRLVLESGDVLEVYLGAETKRLDDYIGLKVKMTGKPREVLGHHEVWPSGIERAGDKD